ncbi:MAG: hypothetical protein LCH79_15200 [Proteobacteria bacterium]|nr:hypothetical protein [Pseudomonadota bacterium]
MAKNSTAPIDMPVTNRNSGVTGDGDTADMKVNVQQHEFGGKTCEIKLYKSADPKLKEQFFGINNYQITIQFDKWVRVPVEMADHIESLIETVREPDPEKPDDEDAYIFADKQRFPLQRRDI